ncbi:methyltransferase domain-containing protein [Leptolyngbya sp. CCNP1308]|uniref:methyltransferase domain-containing protein n=1 Tax=Leptolyngbya sp. CCNP1308 TaxID=3110255 RepID=UPI002B21D3AE|nr:methyltransferase domain-containing protein [Leptolyngbya sp. CCNP1308]MEA5447723.1 methyltransferase domain-containing protein [Leptolyngbya sp. CCNP1308]
MTNVLYKKIQTFYDDSSGLWEQIWGEHMHHGYYGADGRQRKDRRQAQIDLIDECLTWAAVSQAADVLDCGCGIGGSALELATRFGARVTGITLSPVQAQRATERARAANLAGDAVPRATFQVADALNTPFADHSFDLVWSMESGEHMPDKVAFLQECYRVLKPGGKLLMATWCHRPTTSLGGPLTWLEQRQLDWIYRVYGLPYVISLPDYEAIAQNCGFSQLKAADWSLAVAPFWDEVIASALSPEGLAGLLQAGPGTLQGALALGPMRQGLHSGLIRYGLLCAVR